MTNITTGDMARAYLLRHHTSDLKTQMQRLTGELSSGRKADLGKAVAGDFRTLAGIEHSLSSLKAYQTAATEAGLFAGAIQTALETVQDTTAQVSPKLLAAGTSGNVTQVRTSAAEARQALFSAASALNVQIGDRYLLSGTATDQRPVSGGQDILDALTVAIAGQTTAAGVTSAISAWFDAPAGGGGYVDSIYGGSQSALTPFRIGQEAEASIGLTAADPDLREVLKSLAIGAMVAEGALAGDPVGQALLVRTSGQKLISADGNLTAIRADVGVVEAHVADTVTRNAAEASTLEITRNGVIAADPYETASDVEAISTQLETMYTLTARLSRLSLANYLR